MKKKIKIMLCVIFAVCMTAVHTAAIVTDPITPLWDNVNSASCNITFSGTTGTVSCSVRGKSGTTKIEGSLILYKNGTKIDEWEISTTNASVSILDSFTGKSGSKYTLELDVDVTRNGTEENVTASSSKTCP